MSHPLNQEIMERLYDEAWEELHVQIHNEDELHEACLDIAMKRFEFDYS